MLFLRFFFSFVIVSMLAVTGWASWRCPLFAIPPEVYGHPWFIATLFDAYWGFLTFFVWVCFKQTAWLARGSWLVAILLLGNIAMSLYCLAELWRVPRSQGVAGVLTQQRGETGVLGPVLAAVGLAVVALGWAKS